MWKLGDKEGGVLKNGCFWIVVLEKTLESPLHSKIKPVNPKGNQPRKDSCWSYSSYTLATWCKEPTHWKRFCWWERLRAGGEGGNRAWDGWMALPTQWHELSKLQETLKGREACVLQSMGSQRVGHNWVTEQGTATSILAWRIPWTEEPGRLHSMGSQRVLMLQRD